MKGLFVARLWQAIFLVALAGIAWHSMQAVHELGHVAAALLSGHAVRQVVLHPLEISRTDIAGGTTLVIAACGPLMGGLVPLMAWLVAAATGVVWAWLVRGWAGFCLVANGAYIAGDAFLLGGDGKDLVQHGAPLWVLVMLGVAAFAGGLVLLQGIGRELGFGAEPEEISARAAFTALAVWLGLAGILLLV